MKALTSKQLWRGVVRYVFSVDKTKGISDAGNVTGIAC